MNNIDVISYVICVQIALSDVVEPLEFEEYLMQMADAIDRDPFRDVVLFPADDIEVGVVSRKTRTIGPIVPDEKEYVKMIFFLYINKLLTSICKSYIIGIGDKNR